MLGPICCKSYNVTGDPQLLNFLLVQKNKYSLSPLCTWALTSLQAEVWFFKISNRGCRTKGPLPNLGRLTVLSWYIGYEDDWCWLEIGFKFLEAKRFWQFWPIRFYPLCIRKKLSLFFLLVLFSLKIVLQKEHKPWWAGGGLFSEDKDVWS